MTVTVGKKSIILGWEVATVITAFLITTTWGATRFIDNILETQKRIEKKLDAMNKVDTIYYHRTDQNTSDIASLKPQMLYLAQDLKALEALMPIKLRMRYYNQIKTKNGIEFRPIP